MIDSLLFILIFSAYVVWGIITERWYKGYSDRKKTDLLERETVPNSRTRKRLGDTKTRRD